MTNPHEEIRRAADEHIRLLQQQGRKAFQILSDAADKEIYLLEEQGRQIRQRIRDADSSG